MPTYLCHGFRWHRDAIRFFVIVQDVEDAAPGWVVAPRSSDALLTQFYELFDFLPYRDGRPHDSDDLAPPPPQSSPGALGQQGDPATSGGGGGTHTQEIATKRGKSPSRRPRTDDDGEPSTSPTLPQLPDLPGGGEEELPPPSDWSAVTLLEEFDPSNLSIVSGPWAYVADHVVRVDTSAPVVEEMLRYDALERSRDYKAMGSSSSSSSNSSGGSRSDETGRSIVSAVEREGAGWLEKLRDKLQSSELIRWYVVVCGDEERDAYGQQEEEEEEEEEDKYSPKQEEDEDKTIGATSEGHHEQQQQQQQQQRQQQQHPPPKQGGNAGDTGGGGGGDDFKFRLPEFLGSKPRPRDAKADWNAVLEKPPPFFKKDPQPVTFPPSSPLPAGAAAAHKTATPPADASGVRPKTSGTGGFRRFFTRRLGVGRKLKT